MLLADGDLRKLLPEMQFETDDQRRPFTDDQVQPCSIDLRLDRRFWRPRRGYRGGKLDLRNVAQGELEIQRLFQSQGLVSKEGITISPGQMLLGRTYEKFTVPNGYAGKIEGRSTFARLGLSVHTTGDFINPGWRGRMPLQLVNHGVVPIVLAPYLPVCQLLLMRASAPSARPYGSQGLGSKYMDDEGEPSRYWLDQRIRKIQEAWAGTTLSEAIKREFVDAIGGSDIAVVDRFLQFKDRLPIADITNAREVLERFARDDTWRLAWAKRWLLFRRWFTLLPLTTALGLLFKWPYEWPHYLWWLVAVALLPVGVHALFFTDDPDKPFTQRDVDDYFASKRRYIFATRECSVVGGGANQLEPSLLDSVGEHVAGKLGELTDGKPAIAVQRSVDDEPVLEINQLGHTKNLVYSPLEVLVDAGLDRWALHDRHLCFRPRFLVRLRLPLFSIGWPVGRQYAWLL